MLSRLFGKKNKEAVPNTTDSVNVFKTLNNARKGVSISMGFCLLDDVSDNNFVITDAYLYRTRPDSTELTKVLVAQNKGISYRFSEYSVRGTTYVRVDRQIEDEEVQALFMDETEQEADFTEIFEDDLNLRFKLKRFSEEVSAETLAWTTEQYFLPEHGGISTVRWDDKDHIVEGTGESIDFYFMQGSNDRERGIIVEVFDSGMTNVYVSWLTDYNSIEDIFLINKD